MRTARHALLAALLAACSFPTTSGEFTCKLDTDCAGGRTCHDGYCTVGSVGSDTDAGGPPGDAPPVSADASIDALHADATLACVSTGLTCTGTIRATSCGGGCWVSCSDPLPEKTAAMRCISWGGKLTPLRTDTDKACFQSITPGDPAWSGLEQASGQTSVAAGWSWNSDGIVPEGVVWDDGEPNDSDDVENGQEQCAYVDGSNTLSDKTCTPTSPYPFACKR